MIAVAILLIIVGYALVFAGWRNTSLISVFGSAFS